MPFISKTPKPPYYAVIFTSINADVDHAEHTEMYHRMVELAATSDGFLGIEPARNTDGSGVAAIYWKDTNSIAAFSRDPEHLHRQEERPRNLVFALHDPNLQGRAPIRQVRLGASKAQMFSRRKKIGSHVRYWHKADIQNGE